MKQPAMEWRPGLDCWLLRTETPLGDRQVQANLKLAKCGKDLGKRAAAAGGPGGAYSAGLGSAGADANRGERATGPEDDKDREEGEPAPME